jgi:glutamine---fructose-6-phosphate transaminase (isomerizing)
MDRMLSEIVEIPSRARDLLKTPSKVLPLGVPYLGMGSSYFAPLSFKYMGIDIYPEIASEYVHYLSVGKKKPLGVILSQSGKSSEALWCTALFEQYVAVTNYTENDLGNAPNVLDVCAMKAGEEHYSSSKTYINTLLLLFRGFGFDPSVAVDLLVKNMKKYEAKGKEMADKVFEIRNNNPIHGIYITGSGANIGTAMQAALIMGESTKLNFNGLPMAQYDHGPKETAANSIVIQIVAKGAAYQRTLKLSDTLKAAGAHVLTVEEPEAEEHFSILHNSVPFNFMAYYLSKKMGIGETFTVGGKITEVE